MNELIQTIQSLPAIGQDLVDQIKKFPELSPQEKVTIVTQFTAEVAWFFLAPNKAQAISRLARLAKEVKAVQAVVKKVKAFPGLRKVKSKTTVKGTSKLRERWVDKKGNIYEWDYRHSSLEKYNKRGKHLGEFDPQTGKQLRPANPNYRIDP